MPIRLIASDLDGTFFSSQHKPEPRTVEAWNAVSDEGITVVAVTGRIHFDGLPRLLDSGVELDWFIGSNGGHRINVGTGIMEERLAFSDADAALICQTLGSSFDGLGFGWETIDNVGWDDQFMTLYPTTLTGHPRIGRVDKVPTDVSKIFVAHPHMAGVELVDVLSPAVPVDAHVSSSGIWVAEVTPNGADKGSALARLCGELGIDAADVLAFGDNHNDLSMMAWAGRSIAMGNALPAVKEVAGEVTANNDEHGVALVLERLV